MIDQLAGSMVFVGLLLDGRERHSWYLCWCLLYCDLLWNTQSFLKRYKSNNDGRKCLLSIGIALINSAINMEWQRRDDGKYHDEDKPKNGCHRTIEILSINLVSVVCVFSATIKSLMVLHMV